MNQLVFSRALQIGLNFVHLHHAAESGKIKKEAKDVEKEERLKQREREVMSKLKKRDVYNANEYVVQLDKSNVENALEEAKLKKQEKVEIKDEFNADDFLSKRLKDSSKPGKPSENQENNQSLRHRIDKCTLNNPLNYNTLNEKENQESTFNKKKRKLKASSSAAPTPPPKTPKMEPQMKMGEILKRRTNRAERFCQSQRRKKSSRTRTRLTLMTRFKRL